MFGLKVIRSRCTFILNTFYFLIYTILFGISSRNNACTYHYECITYTYKHPQALLSAYITQIYCANIN